MTNIIYVHIQKCYIINIYIYILISDYILNILLLNVNIILIYSHQFYNFYIKKIDKLIILIYYQSIY